MLTLLAAVALAGPHTVPTEEIYVWGDPFERWEKRWTVTSEVRLPKPAVIYSWSTNRELWISAYRVRATLHCNRDFPLGPRTEEVSCEFEDIAMDVATARGGRADQRILDEVDATLTGARFQLQVSAAGDVPNVDLEDVGIAASREQRHRQEALRQLVSRLIVPFHMSMPDVVYDGVRWLEYDSRLLTIPVGATEYVPTSHRQGNLVGGKVAHFLDPYEGFLLVQSIGKATLQNTFEETDKGGSMPSDKYALDLHGVALIDPHDGVMVERSWVVTGEATASSPSALFGGPTYLHHGSLAMLGPGDRPNVGISKVVAAEHWISAAP